MLQGHTHFVTSVAFSPDGNQIVSGSWDWSVRVWDAKTGEQLRELQGHTNYVKSVAFSPDGKQIVSGSVDQSVRVWDIHAITSEQLRELHSCSHDGNRNQPSPMNSSLDFSFVVNKNGWILCDTKHLIWIPPTIHNVLYHPYNTLIISRNGSAIVSFANSKLGHSWHECYTP